MHGRQAFTITALLVAAAFAAAPAAAQTPSYIVVLRDSVSSASTETARLERVHGFRSEHVYGHALKGFAARLGKRQLARVKADPDVAFER